MNKNFLNNISNNLKGRNIFLIGMMASGKSKTGPLLAQMLKYKFIDLDNVIEKVAKKSISKIFLDEGEKIFREYETKCLNEIIKFPSLVISTGGGIVTKNQNWGILRQGIIIWIDLDKKYAIERLSLDKNKRPLLKENNIENDYMRILKSRKKLYEQADFKIKIYNENVQQVADKIILQMEKILSF